MIGGKDIRQWWKLRRVADNAWQVMRSRGRRTGEIGVLLRTGSLLSLRCDRQDYCIFDRIFLRDEYHLAQYAPGPLGCVVDIGANIGLFACRVADRAARVVCYEPMPGNFSLLERNTAGMRNVERVRAAVSDAEGVVRIYHPADDMVSGGFSQYRVGDLHKAEQYDDVPAVTLDTVFSRHGIGQCDLLKIDAEGAEYAILYAASPGTLARVGCICGEYHHVRPDDPKARIAALAAHLESAGFTVVVQPKRALENHGLFFAARRQKT